MMKTYQQQMREQADAEMQRFAKKERQEAMQNNYIGYFKKIVGTKYYRNHKYR